MEKNGIRQLGGFQKVELAPGEERTVTIALDNRAFQYWNTDLHGWREEGGEYAVLVGSSSRDIRLRQAIHRPDGIPAPAYPPCPGAVTREEFAALPGVQYPPPRKSRPFTPDSPVRDLQETLPGPGAGKNPPPGGGKEPGRGGRGQAGGCHGDGDASAFHGPERTLYPAAGAGDH